MQVLFLNGPNLNLLGSREIEIYGNESLQEIAEWLDKQIDYKTKTTWFQSNHEGDLIDQIQASEGLYDGIVLNAGALTHYSYSVRDAIKSVSTPTIEVHFSDIYSREEFRKKSVLKDVCLSQISGLGKEGYLEALKELTNYI
ncbi:MAG: type II 3-dehydroquinate dehydratase [Candidatus Neomarinimicrobiota bacterium]